MASSSDVKSARVENLGPAILKPFAVYYTTYVEDSPEYLYSTHYDKQDAERIAAHLRNGDL